MDLLRASLLAISPLTQSELRLFDSVVQTRQVGKGTCLLQPGQTEKNIYFVKTGLFRLYDLDAQGNEVNRRFTFKGGFAVDFHSFITQKPSRYYLQAMHQAEVSAVTYQGMQYLYDYSKGWERFGRLIAEIGYQQLNERIELMRLPSPEERYQYILNNRPELLERVSLAQLSSYLGIRPESLSRLRKRIISR